MPKAHGTDIHRECTAEQTYERVRPHLARIGITEVIELSETDPLDISVWQATLPGSVDELPVYGGKGLNPAAARTSAVMEAIERFASWLPLRPAVIASYAELAAAGRAAVPPGDHNLRLQPAYHDDAPIFWVAGHDLFQDEPVLVPHGAVAYGPVPGAPPCFEITTTNGLASGNSLEEAICHGLCEVLERDAMTIAEVVGERLGRVRGDHVEVACLDPGTLPPGPRRLFERFAAVGLRLRLRSITTDLGVPSILATVAERDGSHQHTGYGTHPDIEVALTRAITECAQSRAADLEVNEPIVGDRDGLVDVTELPSYPSDDIAADIRFLLDRVRAGGLARAIAVDLSPPKIPVRVVRVVVPGLESWAIDRSKLGYRAADAWNRAVAGNHSTSRS